ncbi:MAG: recombination factor protein RarA [Oleibacter sp.]|nr:recombination factor protein RarA [Thalassolituus sp.]
MAADLFSQENAYEPLASRMRPASLDEYIGQEHVVGPGTPLRRSLDNGQLHSLIFWGPPGVGKTTLARLVANYVDAEFLALSAVMSGVKDIREAVQRAQQFHMRGRKTVLFIDEVHRFNKSQQDAFLPYVEDGTFIFIGATTENPSFELNNALLSRAQVYVLRALSNGQLVNLLSQALQKTGSQADDEALQLIAAAADGDGRRSLNILEMAQQLNPEARLEAQDVKEILGDKTRRFDKGGEAFYDQISALHKSVRGSDPDAALYWMVRMLDGGCDPLYIARRAVAIASEDVGNADPRGLTIALNAWDALERLGTPEGDLNLAHAIVYLACAPKSNAVYRGLARARELVASHPSLEVPLHLRNAPTKLMKELNYGAEYRYAHNEPEAFAAGETYLPEELRHERLYQPSNRGLEGKIGQKLEYLRQLNQQSPLQRYPEDGE